jgi:nucleoporin POM152
MSATPRVRSGAFPQTPATVAHRRAPPTPSPTPSPSTVASPPSHASSKATSTARSPLPLAPQTTPSTRRHPGTSPLIPLRTLNAPTQRTYAAAIYIALQAWKLYDWLGLVEDNTESFWLFLRWIAIDCVFLFGLPELRIPWLELSQPFVVAMFFIHAIFDFILMFNIGVSHSRSREVREETTNDAGDI